MSGTPADRLREAADLLELLDREAGEAPWALDWGYNELRIVRGTAIASPGSHHCVDEVASRDMNDFEEGEPDYATAKANLTLVVALRSLAGPVAAWLRLAAQEIQGTADALFGHGEGDNPRAQRVAANTALGHAALTLADAILGQASGDTTKEEA